LRSTIADAVRLPEGPGWLQGRRAAAHERFEAAALPSPEAEVWRYSRIGELDLDRYVPAPAEQERPVAPALDEIVAAAGEVAALVVVRNGRVVQVQVGEQARRAGLTVGRLCDLDADGTLLGEVAGAAPDALAELHDALASDPVLVSVKPGGVVELPVLVVHWTDADASVSAPHLVVRAGENSEVTVYDHQASADVDALVLPLVELDVGPGGEAPLPERPDARPPGVAARSAGQSRRPRRPPGHRHGGARRRLRPPLGRLHDDRQGRLGDMLAVYFGEGSQLLDFRTTQDHVAPATTSNLLFKGAVQDTSRAVYTGLIHIGKEAAGVNAFQTNRNVKLSSGAWAESGAEPGDREQRRALQPRLGGRAGRRGPALLPGEQGRAAPGGGAPRRARLLRGGPRAPARARRRRPPASRDRRQAGPPHRGGGPVSPVGAGERLCAVADLEVGAGNLFEVGGHRICVVRFDDGSVYAIGDTCSHANVSLSEGEVDPLTRHIECWKHGSSFSLETGEPTPCRPRSRSRPTGWSSTATT
jgi:Fe-S cluster assembly protein SufD